MNDNLTFNYPNNFYNIQEKNIEDILKQNKGKVTKIHTTINDDNKIFNGIIEESTKDAIVISSPSNGKWYLIKIDYIDFIEFEESINYNKNNI